MLGRLLKRKIRRIIVASGSKTVGPNPGFEKSKAKAYEYVLSIIDEVSKKHDFNYNQIKIKNQKARWGSCSSNKNLNFNYRILYLPKKIAKYLVVHELCHLKQMNHSKKYWALVEKVMPDYKLYDDELRKFRI